jgi:hypothetical protein
VLAFFKVHLRETRHFRAREIDGRRIDNRRCRKLVGKSARELGGQKDCREDETQMTDLWLIGGLMSAKGLACSSPGPVHHCDYGR